MVLWRRGPWVLGRGLGRGAFVVCGVGAFGVRVEVKWTRWWVEEGREKRERRNANGSIMRRSEE